VVVSLSYAALTRNQVLENHAHDAKRVYYLSRAFLIGCILGDILVNLGCLNVAAQAMHKFGYNHKNLRDTERNAGLGNGGLGRLAGCRLGGRVLVANGACSMSGG
jgi:glucan phosphorylase